jgi:hypothetical protein
MPTQSQERKGGPTHLTVARAGWRNGLVLGPRIAWTHIRAHPIARRCWRLGLVFQREGAALANGATNLPPPNTPTTLLFLHHRSLSNIEHQPRWMSRCSVRPGTLHRHKRCSSGSQYPRPSGMVWLQKSRPRRCGMTGSPCRRWPCSLLPQSGPHCSFGSPHTRHRWRWCRASSQSGQAHTPCSCCTDDWTCRWPLAPQTETWWRIAASWRYTHSASAGDTAQHREWRDIRHDRQQDGTHCSAERRHRVDRTRSWSDWDTASMRCCSKTQSTPRCHPPLQSCTPPPDLP